MGDGRLGYPQLGPYDVIHVGAAGIYIYKCITHSPSTPTSPFPLLQAQPIPECLLAQLKSPGRMIIPVGDQGSFQELLQIDRDSQGKLTMKSVMGVMYVPLTDVKDQVGGGML